LTLTARLPLSPAAMAASAALWQVEIIPYRF
jgi:hypothetical protein